MTSPIVAGALLVIATELEEGKVWAEITPCDNDFEIITSRGNVEALSEILVRIFEQIELEYMIQTQKLGDVLSLMLVTMCPDPIPSD